MIRLLFILLISLSCSSQAQPVASQLQEDTAGATIYHLKSDALNPAGLPPVSGNDWNPLAANTANFGYTPDQHWFYSRLTNSTDRAQERILTVRAAHLDVVEYFVGADGKVLHSSLSGDRYPFAQRELRYPYFVYAVTIPANSFRDIYFRVQSEGSLLFPLEIWEPEAFYAHNDDLAMGQGLYFGFLLSVVIFGLFIYIGLRETTYLFYVLLTSMVLLLHLNLTGRSFQYLWPGMPALQNGVILFALPMATLALSEFTRRFLQTDKVSLISHRILLCFSALSVLSLLLIPLLPTYLSKEFSVVLALSAIITVSIVAIYFWVQGVRQARLFTCAWTGFQIGAAVTLLTNLGFLSPSLLTDYALEFGSALQATLMSLAIVDRIYHERQQRTRSQQQVIEAQSRQQKMEQRHLYEATHHAVTELPNRTLLERFISQYDKQARTSPLALCLINLNRYHDIDLTMGQENAEQLLYQVAHQINELVAREDEALVIEQQSGHPVFVASVDDVTLAVLLPAPQQVLESRTLQALTSYLLKRTEFGHLSLDLDPRIGIANYPDHSRTAPGLIRLAKIALDATRHSQQCTAIYSDAINPYSERRLTLMAELEKAIDRHELLLHFQPQLNLRNRQISSFEALIRWQHKRFGNVPPDEFIHLAEQTGLIHKLTLWVLESAMSRLVDLADAGHDDVRIAINISTVDLEVSHFPDEVVALLQRYPVSPRLLTLELTETALMREPDSAMAALQRLSGLGFQIALDDFGAGYSSLSYIQRLPLHKIKIDRSLISNLHRSEESRVIARSAIEMAHALRYNIIAEGVEERDTMEYLQEMNCDQIQGYWLARPMLWEFALEWLNAYKREHVQVYRQEQSVAACRPQTPQEVTSILPQAEGGAASTQR